MNYCEKWKEKNLEFLDKKEIRIREMRKRENPTTQRRAHTHTKPRFINVLVNFYYARDNDRYFKNYYFSVPFKIICIANI